VLPSEESDQPLEILDRRRQEKLLGHVPESSQPDSAEADTLLELAKQGLDRVPGPLRADIGGRADQSAHGLTGRLLPVHEESASGAAGAPALLRTSLTLRGGGAVDVTVAEYKEVCAVPWANTLWLRGECGRELFRPGEGDRPSIFWPHRYLAC